MTALVMTGAQMLREGADYIAAHGLCKDGTYGYVGGPCCALGALAVVATGDPDGGFTATQDARFALMDALPVHPAFWSDAPDRTADEVIAKMREVADGLEATP